MDLTFVRSYLEERMSNDAEFRNMVANDPDHLMVMPLSESPALNEEKSQSSYAVLRNKGIIEYDRDTKTSIWKGQLKINRDGRRYPYLRVLFASLCKLGSPAGYCPIVCSDKEHDVTLKNMYLVKDPAVTRAVKYDADYVPMVSGWGWLKIFGNKSASEMYNQMVSSTDPDAAERWREILNFSIFADIKLGLDSGFESKGIEAIEDNYGSNRTITNRVDYHLRSCDNIDLDLVGPCYSTIRKMGDLESFIVSAYSIRIDMVYWKLHHVMYQMVFRQSVSTTNSSMLRTCTNKWCLNPFHFELGTKDK